MPCIYPLTAWQTDAGQIYFKGNVGMQRQLQLPCGQCIECRLERTRQWGVRIMHEAQLHISNYFATLTYKDSPRELDHKHFQDFMKRLRWKHGALRYYMCGEYGEKGGRPHYHAVLFGLHLADLELYSENQGNKLYTSKTLDDAWQRGFATVGAVTMQSAQYVAAYCTKKVTGEKAEEHYTRVDVETGEVYQITPEYARMSLKPGIAHEWIKKYTDDVYNYDHVIINGRRQKPPRYYDKYLEETDKNRKENLKPKRRERAEIMEKDNTKERRKVKETITNARIKLKQRTF